MELPTYRPLAGRRPTRTVRVGKIAIGGDNPVRIQSMITSDTMDTAACVKETLDLVAVGCEIVRITAPTVNDARNLEHIRASLRSQRCDVPLVADIHFKPDAALEAARWVDKIRINPGNFADSKKFNIREYSDSEYDAEIGRIRDRFTPLVNLCKERGVAMRIGTNHGSLSDRIMNRYGDSPLGMVESALEFAQIARDLDYHDLVFSMKSSNPKVMIHAYRLLVARLDCLGEWKMRNEECEMDKSRAPRGSSISNSSFPISDSPWNYPVHLGVTEAGDGEDGRIKSAIGIGSLLADGIGDTIRVSLTEDSVHEIPVAQALVALAEERWRSRPSYENSSAEGMPVPPVKPAALPFDPFSYARRTSQKISAAGIPTGGDEPVRVAWRRNPASEHEAPAVGTPASIASSEFQPELACEEAQALEIDPRDDETIEAANALREACLVTVPDSCNMNVIPAFRMLAARLAPRHPILLKDTFAQDQNHPLLAAATNIGSLLCDGIGDAILVQGEKDPRQALRIAYNTLQAAGVRIFKTDYVACPSCGRTLFNLQETTARIKAATAHLKGLKIAVMGCIVNGPGEMADADFGYVGGAPGKINLYVNKTPVKFNIPETEAVSQLIDLIREHGSWIEPQSR